MLHFFVAATVLTNYDFYPLIRLFPSAVYRGCVEANLASPPYIPGTTAVYRPSSRHDPVPRATTDARGGNHMSTTPHPLQAAVNAAVEKVNNNPGKVTVEQAQRFQELHLAITTNATTDPAAAEAAARELIARADALVATPASAASPAPIVSSGTPSSTTPSSPSSPAGPVIWPPKPVLPLSGSTPPASALSPASPGTWPGVRNWRPVAPPTSATSASPVVTPTGGVTIDQIDALFESKLKTSDGTPVIEAVDDLANRVSAVEDKVGLGRKPWYVRLFERRS